MPRVDELDTTISRASGWIAETLGGDLVMLDPSRDCYLRLNRTGALLWQALAEPATVRELADALTQAEGIPADRAGQDALAFVNHLMEHGAATVI
jgi:hypothetical protein